MTLAFSNLSIPVSARQYPSSRFLHRCCSRFQRVPTCVPRRKNVQLEKSPSTACSSQDDLRLFTALAMPMTSGADVLFPGGSQVMSLSTEISQRLNTVCENDRPEFAYICINAWGDPGTVGTLAVIDELYEEPSKDKATLVCTGTSRFQIVHLDENMHNARVQILNDHEPKSDQLALINDLEQRLITTLTQIVQLSIKIAPEKEEQRLALTDTLKRVRALYGEDGHEESRNLLRPWILQLSPNRRRELFSFIFVDLLGDSFMDRRRFLMGTDTGKRLFVALKGLEPYVKELAAKGAIVSALGMDTDAQLS